MRPSLLLLALPFLSACVVEGSGIGPAAEPGKLGIVDAVASPSRLVVRLSDGTRCVAPRPEEARAGWSGVTAECGYALPFQVTFKQGGAPTRFLIEDPTGIPQAEDGRPGPRAETFITDVDGQRRLFITPLGDNVQFNPAT